MVFRKFSFVKIGSLLLFSGFVLQKYFTEWIKERGERDDHEKVCFIVSCSGYAGYYGWLFSYKPSNQSLACLACEGEDGGVVDKTPCEAFIVKITFKNTGTTEGTWSVNIAFEGEA